MKSEITNQNYGKILYTESFWTGKRTLFVEGKMLEKSGKKEFTMPDGKIGVLKGNTLTGVSLCVGVDVISLTPKLKWYEVVFSILPFIFIMVWGNSTALCAIFPVVGGAIGGGIAGLCVAGNLFLVKLTNNIFLKILISLIVFAACVFACYGIAMAILSAV